MKFSRKRFVLVFLICAFSFQATSYALLSSKVRFFPRNNQPLFTTTAQAPWEQSVTKLILPARIILI